MEDILVYMRGCLGFCWCLSMERYIAVRDDVEFNGEVERFKNVNTESGLWSFENMEPHCRRRSGGRGGFTRVHLNDIDPIMTSIS